MNKFPVKYQRLAAYAIPVVLAAIVKLFIWSPDVTPFNADEAIVALMARHINQGQLPVFFYGQYYMGSLDAILTAVIFRYVGESIAAIRILQSFLYLGTVLTTVILAFRILKSYRSAMLAGFLIAVPPVNVSLYTTVSLGGYGELLLIGNLLLLGGMNIITEIKGGRLTPDLSFFLNLLFWGIGAGFAFWVIGLSVVYSVPILIIGGWKLRGSGPKMIGSAASAVLLGGLIGSSPWWVTGLIRGNLAIFSELFGSAIAGANQGPWIFQSLKRMISLLVFGGTVITGLRPPWSVQWLMLPLLPIVLTFWMAVLIHTFKRIFETGSEPLHLLALMGATLCVGFILSPYGDDPSGRYFLPLIVPMAVFAVDMVSRQLGKNQIIQAALVFMVMVFNLGGTLQSRSKNPPGLTTQFDPVAQVNHAHTRELISFLEQNNINRGYSNYWVSYPLAFLSGEKLIFSPRLPYHQDFRYTDRDDRYPDYTDLVSGSSDIAYITTHHPDLDRYLTSSFRGLDISWSERKIGDYTVYYDLTDTVHVLDIGLGETTSP